MSLYIRDTADYIEALAPGVRTANVTNAPIIDTLGLIDGALVIHTGAVDTTDTDETYVIKVLESDASDLSGSSEVESLETEVTEAGVQVVRLPELNIQTKRYLRVTLTVGGTSPSFTGSAVLVAGKKDVS